MCKEETHKSAHGPCCRITAQVRIAFNTKIPLTLSHREKIPVAFFMGLSVAAA